MSEATERSVPQIRKATRHDIAELARTLASAFSEDPVFTWLVPTRNRFERLRRFFAAQLGNALRHESVFTTDDLNGAAVWLPPDQWKIPAGDIVRMTPTMVRTFGRALPRSLGTLSTMEKRHPKDPPHWYLEFLGTRQDLQRRGLGTAVLGPVLERCDREGVAAYLEASSSDNVPFCRRHGFEVREDIAFKNGPSVWAMMREPR